MKSDRERYEELTSSLIQQAIVILKAQKEHDQTWAELEAIKNRNGGFPPPKEEAVCSD